ncbi:MAG: hypothetical protein BWK76_24745, partial [Desulfobulbaceae bacterium A2]
GGGADTLLGGLGDDIYLADADDVILENPDEGTDTVQTDIGYTLAANIENLTLLGSDAINGAGNELNNVLTGNSGVNTLTGGAGNDTLDGGAGADTLLGGTGNDIYIVDAVDTLVENAGEGIDLVQANIAYTLGDNFENLTLTGSAAVSGAGNALDNVLTGNSAANTLSGGAGNDLLDGKAGSDTQQGGLGDDVYIVDTTDVIVENADEGLDTVLASTSHTLAAHVENLTLTGTGGFSGTGNALNNVLIGNDAANTLNGGAGNDTFDPAWITQTNTADYLLAAA